MSVANFLTIYLLCIFSLWNVVLSQDIALSMGTPVEKESLTLTCTYSGNDTVQAVTWYIVVGAVGGIDDTPKGTITSACATFGAAPDASLYEYACSSATIYTWTIKSVTKSSNEDQKWACSFNLDSGGAAILSGDVTITFPNPTVPCECKCKFDAGKIAYLVVDLLIDLAFVVGIYLLTCPGKGPEGAMKNVLIVVSIVVVVLLDIGLTIYYFAQDCGDDCTEACESECCTKGLRISTAVVAWIPIDFAGYIMLLRSFLCGGN